MTVLGSLGVDGLGQVQVTDDHTRTEIKVVADDLHQLVGGSGRSAVGLDEDGEGLGNTDGVRQLDKSTASQLGVNEGLGDPARNVGGRTVDLGVVLAGESTTTVGTPATVGVDDDLTASETGITLRTTNDEAAGRLKVVDGAVIQQVVGDDLADDLLLENGTELLSGDIVSVLGGDDDGVDAQRLDGTVVVGVLNGDLGLGVREQPGDGAVLASSLHGSVELVGEEDSEGQELRGLIGGIAEHDTLVTSTELLQSLVIVETLGDIRRLLLNGDQDVAGLVVEALLRGIVADVLDGTTDDLLVVQLGLGGNLTKDHNHTCEGDRCQHCRQARLSMD